MGKTYRKNDRARDEDVYVRSKRRSEPDLRRLARATLAIAEAQAEVEAEAAHLTGRLAPPRPKENHRRTKAKPPGSTTSSSNVATSGSTA